jgi:hypothetical protein
MIPRRHLLRSAMLTLAALALAVPAHLALAQQTSGKATVKISELRPIVTQYVDHLSQLSKEHTGVEFSAEEKQQMVEDTISQMKTEGFYAYIDP